MQRALVIYAHPNPLSLNHAILETTLATLKKRGAAVRVLDLYAMNFNPVLSGDELANRAVVFPDVAAAQQDVTWADTLIFIYPIWWMDRPAILKGWCDRVFTNGFAFTVRDGWKGLLSGRKAIVLQTAGGTAELFRGDGEIIVHGSIGEGTLGFVGITDVIIKTFYNVVADSDEARQKMLEEVAAIIR